jgi:RNA polymerase sigma-70 factor (ECF subfamily)
MLPYIMLIQNESDRNKVEQIYKRYGSTMLYVADSILHDRYLAEEAVSEAFIRIINHLQKINAENCYQTRGFVVIIVRNISLNLLKQQNHHRTEPLEEYFDDSDCPEPTFDAVTNQEACSRIVEAIGTLKQTYSEVLYLKIKFEYSDQEIAKLLGISQENVKMRLSRARTALKKELSKEGVLE